MKGVWKFILAILAAAIGGLVVIAFQDPIARAFNQDRLLMTVYAGPWSPFASSSTNLTQQWERQGLPPYFIRRLQDGEELFMVRIVVENPGSQVVDRVRIAPDEYGPENWLILEAGEDPRIVETSNEILLGSFEPGEEAVVYAWSYHDLTTPYRYVGWRTFSTEGPAVFRLRAPSAKDDLFNAVGDWAGYLVVAFLVVGFILVMLVAAFYEAYVKQLMSDENHYLNERVKFEDNPKRFEPKLKA